VDPPTLVGAGRHGRGELPCLGCRLVSVRCNNFGISLFECGFHDKSCLQPDSSVHERSKLRSASTRLVDIPTHCLAGGLVSL